MLLIPPGLIVDLGTLYELYYGGFWNMHVCEHCSTKLYQHI